MAAPLLETPSRVLRRVMEAEDVELPSLPSIVDHFDETSDDGMYTRDDSEQYTQQTPAKASLLPRSRLRDTLTPLGDITSSSLNTSGPLFPPRSSSSSAPSSPFIAATAKPSTSTPTTVRDTWSQASQSSAPPTARHDQADRHFRRPSQSGLSLSRSDSKTLEEPTSSTVKTAVYVPGEMSLSFDGMPIADDLDRSGSSTSGSSVSDMDKDDVIQESKSPEDQHHDDASSQHTSDTPPERRLSNVLLTRPHRRAQSNRYEAISLNDNYGSQHPRTPSASDRIPSLSRSSDDDSSAAAHTPEQGHQATFPSTIMEAAPHLENDDHEQMDESLSQSDMATPLPFKASNRRLRNPSPLHEEHTGDGLGSDDVEYPDFSTTVPYTPAPGRNADMTPQQSVWQTPRAGATEAEWRKNHVLAVLQSTAKAGRRVPSTPFPSARTAEATGAATPRTGMHGSSLQTPIQTATNRSFELGDGSFVSVASSADLTSDRRASTAAHATSHRGNSSFPNILLPTGLSHGSGGPGHRVDGAKLQKHLNAMNKQLLEENRELAQSLDMWQEQAERQRLRLQELGDGIDDSLELPVLNSDSAFGATDRQVNLSDDSRHALLQEMAEKIEALEKQIVSKETEVNELRKQISSSSLALDLQTQLETSQANVEQLQAEHAKRTEEHASKFEEICGGYQSTIDALETRLATSQAVDTGRNPEIRLGSTQSQDQMLQLAEQRVSAAEASAEQLKSRLASAEEELQRSKSGMETLQRKHDAEKAAQTEAHISIEAELQKTQLDAQQAQEKIHGMTDERSRLQSANLTLDKQLQVAQDDVDRLKALEADQDRQIQDLEDALDEAERQLEADEVELNQWRQGQYASSPKSSSSSRDVDNTQETSLQKELDEAHREVGRLQQRMNDDKSAYQAEQQRFNDLIKSLERERDSLCKQLSGGDRRQSAILATPTGPILKSLAALRTPGPLREMSWMNSTVGEASEGVLRAQVDHLRSELAAANEQLDGNFSRLETAGASAVELAERLAVAENRVAELEKELADRNGMRTKASARQQHVPSPVANRLAELQVDMKQERERLQRESERLRTTITMMQAEHAQAVRMLRSEISSKERTKANLIEELDSLKRVNIQLADTKSGLERGTTISRCRDQEEQAKVQTQLDKERLRSATLNSRLTETNEEVKVKEAMLVQLHQERQRHLQDLAAFDQDLKRYRKDAEQLNNDLRHWRSQADIRAHVSSSDGMRTLAGQIKYLKAKFTREASFRNALCLQKRYLLLLVGGMSLNEQATLAAIASMGFPAPAPAPRKRTLRAVVLACIATIRARKAASAWQIEVNAKRDLIAARAASRHERK